MTREDQATQLITKCEGRKLFAYPDTRGIWTIGVGTTHYPDGTAVRKGDTCTIQESDEYLLSHLTKHVFPLLEGYDIPDSVYAACSSFIYNEGHLGSSLVAALNNQDWDALAEAFRKYVYSAGVYVEGLANRREIEIKYFQNLLPN